MHKKETFAPREYRGMGLGFELLRLTMDVARALKCDHYFSSGSGIYSQKIFADAGFVVMRFMKYKNIVDRRNPDRRVLNDTREHTHVNTVSFKFSNTLWTKMNWEL